MGPGEGAAPGWGCGKAVEVAVWKVMFPSTFCTIWWIWPGSFNALERDTSTGQRVLFRGLYRFAVRRTQLDRGHVQGLSTGGGV